MNKEYNRSMLRIKRMVLQYRQVFEPILIETQAGTVEIKIYKSLCHHRFRFKGTMININVNGKRVPISANRINVKSMCKGLKAIKENFIPQQLLIATLELPIIEMGSSCDGMERFRLTLEEFKHYILKENSYSIKFTGNSLSW